MQRRPSEDDVCGRAVCVLEHVRECFLDDSVGGDRDAGGHCARLALDAQLDGQASLADVLDQRRDLGHSRLR